MVTGWPTLWNTVDNVFLFIIAISLVLLLGITATMIYFVVRYSRKRNPHAENIEGNTMLEIVWTIIPTILVLAIFYAGWKGFLYMRTVPDDAMPVKVSARMWSWSFEYENGRKSGTLKVPAGRPVKLIITSEDVLHGLFIPAFRVKEDAVPGMETYLWFLPHEPGSYDLFCTEYCGVGHSAMITKVEVMPEKAFAAWYEVKQPQKRSEGTSKHAPTAQKEKNYGVGARLAQVKGCLLCHSLDGTAKVGPTFKGIAGRKTVVVTSGKDREIIVDEVYLVRSLLEPQADVVKGFPPIMPSQKGILSDAEIKTIIEYLKSLK
ncbi:MAG: cytochrome c oxidase subunit II [Nitrospirae bacterium GWC2_57_13]|nr:MAG: cytochrome c oxidase subunit II [Nitrospirae bacterium GWC2_57_13]OGW46220.1 MAG: cytochrome c oxidase subunit II [Nitrospirae bacterium GWD2_57_8]